MDAAGALLAWIVLPAVVISGFVSVAGIARPATARIAGAVEWCGLLVATGLLVLYVAGEDSYRDNGTSRWDAYGAHGATTVAVVAGIGAALFVFIAWLFGLRRLAVVAYLGALAAAFLLVAADLANSLN